MDAMGQLVEGFVPTTSTTVQEKRSRGNPTIAVTRAYTAREISSAVSLIVTEYHRKKYLESDDVQAHETQRMALANYSMYVAWKHDRPLTTLGFTTSDPLPMDTIFGSELDRIRSQGIRIGEIGKLAGRASFSIVLRLMAEVFVREASMAVDMIAITVNPSHLDFYLDHLGFTLLSPTPKFLSSVNNAPAYGLIAPLAHIQAQSLPAKVLAGFSTSCV